MSDHYDFDLDSDTARLWRGLRNALAFLSAVALLAYAAVSWGARDCTFQCCPLQSHHCSKPQLQPDTSRRLPRDVRLDVRRAHDDHDDCRVEITKCPDQPVVFTNVIDIQCVGRRRRTAALECKGDRCVCRGRANIWIKPMEVTP